MRINIRRNRSATIVGRRLCSGPQLARTAWCTRISLSISLITRHFDPLFRISSQLYNWTKGCASFLGAMLGLETPIAIGDRVQPRIETIDDERAMLLFEPENGR